MSFALTESENDNTYGDARWLMTVTVAGVNSRSYYISLFESLFDKQAGKVAWSGTGAPSFGFQVGMSAMSPNTLPKHASYRFRRQSAIQHCPRPSSRTLWEED
jgi:hypothetical protein